jgi:hypothetical protein
MMEFPAKAHKMIEIPEHTGFMGRERNVHPWIESPTMA